MKSVLRQLRSFLTFTPAKVGAEIGESRGAYEFHLWSFHFADSGDVEKLPGNSIGDAFSWGYYANGFMNRRIFSPVLLAIAQCIIIPFAFSLSNYLTAVLIVLDVLPLLLICGESIIELARCARGTAENRRVDSFSRVAAFALAWFDIACEIAVGIIATILSSGKPAETLFFGALACRVYSMHNMRLPFAFQVAGIFTVTIANVIFACCASGFTGADRVFVIFSAVGVTPCMAFMCFMALHSEFYEFISCEILRIKKEQLSAANRNFQNLIEKSMPNRIAKKVMRGIINHQSPHFHESCPNGGVMFMEVLFSDAVLPETSTRSAASGMRNAAATLEFGCVSNAKKEFDLLLNVKAYCEECGIESIKIYNSTFLIAADSLIEADNVNAFIALVQYIRRWLIAREIHNGTIIRAGICCNGFVGGIVGTSILCYDIWGDSVNVAARLMREAKNNEICIVSQHDDELPTDVLTKMSLKGKGEVEAFRVDLTNFPDARPNAHSDSYYQIHEVSNSPGTSSRDSISEIATISSPYWSKSKNSITNGWWSTQLSSELRQRMVKGNIDIITAVITTLGFSFTPISGFINGEVQKLSSVQQAVFAALIATTAILFASAPIYLRCGSRAKQTHEVDKNTYYGAIAYTMYIMQISTACSIACVIAAIFVKSPIWVFYDCILITTQIIPVSNYFFALIIINVPTIVICFAAGVPNKEIYAISVLTACLIDALKMIHAARSTETAHLVRRTSEAEAQLLLKTNESYGELYAQMVPARMAQYIETEGSTCLELGICSVLFADVVNFTGICSRVSPVDIVQGVNEIFSRFDSILTSAQFAGRIGKLITLGDAYVAVSNIFDITRDHEIAVLEFAHAILDNLRKKAICIGGLPIEIRVGIASSKMTIVSTRSNRNGWFYGCKGDALKEAEYLQAKAPIGGIVVHFYGGTEIQIPPANIAEDIKRVCAASKLMR
ncbi:MAG: adenylate/guanylate cyclase domain-containing protein [Methylomonas sp.]|nr:adenylate/guanylate cyclase domain-containing protein [Methylomonas sp.]